MTTTEAREDLVRGLLQSCYVIEQARANVQRLWGGDFLEDEQRTRQRAERLKQLLTDRGFRVPDDVVEAHTAWFTSLCGKRPDEVFLGAAVLHTFGRWSDGFAAPYLDDLDDFKALGKEHARYELDFQPVTEDLTLLEPLELPEGRRFVILTDIHIGSHKRDALLKIVVDDINAISPEFVIVPGDITEDGEPEQFLEVKRLLDSLDCPYYVVPGNHDVIQRSTREPRAPEFWKAAFGEEPHDHFLEIGDLQIALVDSTDPTASPFPDWDVANGKFGEGIAAGVDSGSFRPGQAQAIADALDKKRPSLVVQHHEVHPFPGFPPVKFALREEDAAEELDALKDHRLVALIAGHTHRSARLKVRNDVTMLEIPSMKDWPFGFSVAGVGEDGVHVVFRQLSDRNAVWDIARNLIPIALRFALGPLSDLDARLPFPA
ncbi:MAG: metallophosphoesterase [Actinomycetota bacterium]